MKNLKLKQKFLVGFGVPVLLVVLIAISVIFTNLSVMKSIQETTSAASLSEYGRVIQKNFLSAQIYSRAIQEQTTYNEVDLKNFEKEIQLAIETLEEASDFASSDEELKLFTADFEASKESFNLYSAIVSRYVELFKNNIDPSVEELNRTGEVVVEEFSILKDGYLDRLTNEAGNYEKILSRSYKFEKLLTAMAGLSELRVKVEHQIKRYVPENNAEITAINAEILDLADMGLKSAHNDPDNIKAAWESIIDAQNAYQNAYDEYAKALEEQLELKTQLHDTSEETEIRLERVINDVAVRSGEIGESSQQTAITALAIVISITAVTVVVSIIMARRLTESISVPLSHITEILGQIGGKGQVEFSETQLEKMHVIGRGKDEIAKSVKMLELTADRLGLIGEKLRLISDGDLSFKMNSLSSEDVLGRAGRRMLKNLNRMFRDINYTADKILSDAKKITEVSEILASGASEQAASIEEISEGIGLIFANTKANEEMTEKAVMLASEIKQNADKSTDEMAELMRAVNEISESSDEIANVIGTIDSIAFQTNLLALNAATEAARAGFYGKGFAVVAGEVRRLAIQSSAAAKETHDLIEKSLAKTKQGRVIAETTADSLAEIVMGITASTDIINKIAQCSGEQTSSIYVINEKLANIIDVVQETSRTASESAESAAGLNDQAAILTEHTDKFKLRYD